MTKPFAALFDLDGTLLDTLDDLTNAVNHALSRSCFSVRTRDEVRRFVGDGVAMLIKRACPPGTGEADEATVRSAFGEYYMAHLDNFTQPYPYMTEVVSRLHREGVYLAVVTNKPNDAAEKLIRKFFGNDIDSVFGVTNPSERKPSPLLPNKALRESGCESAVLIGDSPTDIMTARNAGIRCVSVTWGFRSESQLIEAGAETLLSDVRDLPAALDKISDELYNIG